MDNVEKLVKEIQSNNRIRKTRFHGNRLVNTVGEVYERDGYGAAKLLLQEKARDRRTQFEAQSLLEALDLVKSANVPPSVGGYVIRKLPLIVSSWASW